MNVAHVLARKPASGVESIGEQETVASLIKHLADKKIGALMVLSPESELIGVISERDIVRGLAADRENCLQHPVSRYMTREVQTATPAEDVERVLERMTSGRFRHMPVLSDGGVVGVVSIGDLVKARIEALQSENAAMAEFIRS